MFGDNVHVFTLKLATGEIVTGPIQGSGGAIPKGRDAVARLQTQIERANEGEPLGIYEPYPRHASLHLPDPDQNLPVNKRRREIDLRGAELVTPPVVELRKIRIVDRMSQETICFVADLYVDGKRAGTAENNGHGGSTFVRFLDHGPMGSEIARRLERYVTEIRKVPANERFDGAAEYLVDEIVYAELARRDAAKLAKKIARNDVKESARFAARGLLCVRFRTGDDIRWAGMPPGKTLDDLRAHFTAKYGELTDLVVVS